MAERERNQRGSATEPAAGTSNAKVTWRGIVDATPSERAPRRLTSTVGSALRHLLVSLGLLRPRLADGSLGHRRTGRLVAFGATVGALALLVSMGHVIDPGTVAVPETLGSAGGPLDEGFHLTAPWPFVMVSTMSVRTQNYTMTSVDLAGSDDPVIVLGSDGASGAVDATLLYRLEADRATDVYREVGANFTDKIVKPTTRSCIRSEFARHDMVSAATTELADVSDGIATCISDTIEPLGIRMEDFQLRDVALGPDVQAAIDAKVSAQQKAESQRFEVATAERQADIARIRAEARADSAQIIACGGTVEEVERDGVVSEEIIPNPPETCTAPPLTPEELQYDYIQALREIINSPNNSTIVVPEGQDMSPVLGLDTEGG